MTTNVTVQAKKRNFIIPVDASVKSSTSALWALASDTRVARNGDIRVTRNGDIRIAHNTITGYPLVRRAKKRGFTVVTKVKNG